MAIKEREVRKIAKNNILTTNELCMKLKVSRQYISMLVKKGRIEPFLISPGKHYYWWEPDIDALVEAEPKLFKGNRQG